MANTLTFKKIGVQDPTDDLVCYEVLKDGVLLGTVSQYTSNETVRFAGQQFGKNVIKKHWRINDSYRVTYSTRQEAATWLVIKSQ